jgi:hypothetical protein
LSIIKRIVFASVLLCAALLISLQPALAQFVQQGPKLVGTGDTGGANQGNSAALSADGNTAMPELREANGPCARDAAS